MAYYTQNDAGEYLEVDADEMFKDRHDRWVKSESEKVRKEVETSIRDELTPTITKEVEDRVKGEYETKLSDATANTTKLETQLRQKTIAAEYGFKPGTEKYLGEGTEEEMRKEADTLKTSFATAGTPPEKVTGKGQSKIQKKTGLQVTI